MRNVFMLLVILLVAENGFAQDDPLLEIKKNVEKNVVNDTSHISGWKRGGTFNVGLGQGSSSNWAGGAEIFSLSLSGYISTFANYKQGDFSWYNTLDLGYALMNNSSLSTRKTDDKIDLYSKALNSLSDKLSIGGVVNFRTQFDKGVDYNYLGKDLQRRTSSFFAPAYLILAPGIDWQPGSNFSLFFSPIGARFVIVARHHKSYYFPNGEIPDAVVTTPDYELPLSILYGVNPDKNVRTEVGGFASAKFSKEILKNVSYNSRLDFYSNYLKTDRFEMTGPDTYLATKEGSKPQNVDVFWTNQLAFKVNKYINVGYNVDIVYDDDIRQFGPKANAPRTQFRSYLSVGFNTSW